MLVGSLVGLLAAADDAGPLENLVARHGYALPMPAGTLWADYGELALATNAIYAYAPVLKSPPPLEAGTPANRQVIACDNAICTVDAAKAKEGGHVVAAVKELIKEYTGKTPDIAEGVPIPISVFGSMGVQNRACRADADCGSGLSCCDDDAAGVFPGLCCSTDKLNQYDAEVPQWVWIFFLSGAGLLLTGWVIQSFHLLDSFF